MIPKTIHRLHTVFTVFIYILTVGIHHSATAQSVNPGDVEVDLEMLPIVTNAQSLSLAQLGIDSKGAGNQLFTMVIENRTSNAISELYLSASVNAAGVGKLVELEMNGPFSLTANQIVIANNNSLQEGIPGVPERLGSTGDLTPEGEDFINDLKGSTQFPDLVYTVTVQIHFGGPKGQGILISESVASIPTEVLNEEIDVFLVQPGDAIGADAPPVLIQYPTYRWEGTPRTLYRLIVVEETEGQTPESLLQASLSSDPVIAQNIPADYSLPLSANGDLLEFEMIDALIFNTAFNYPAGGSAQQLKQGSTYYWQVFALNSTPSGVQSQASEIYEFTIGSGGTADGGSGSVASFPEFLKNLIGNEAFEALRQNGFRLQTITLDGAPITINQLETLYNIECVNNSGNEENKSSLCGDTDQL